MLALEGGHSTRHKASSQVTGTTGTGALLQAHITWQNSNCAATPYSAFFFCFFLLWVQLALFVYT
jgi:hypothetical protein